MREDVSARPWFVRYLLRLRGASGFTLIEVVFAMILFAGLAAAMAGLLTSAVSANKFARQRTLADQAALEQIEAIRRLDYDDVGTILGNPPGVVAPTTTITKVGLDATITIQIRYVDDPTPTSYETNANYKRVMVSVRRTSDSQLLAREVTYVAPSSRTPFGGVNLAIIQPLVIDYGTNAPIENATVTLLTGPSAPRSDVTDSSGSVSFKKLTPNADRDLSERLLRPHRDSFRVCPARLPDTGQRRSGTDGQSDDPDLSPIDDQRARQGLRRSTVRRHGVGEADVRAERGDPDVQRHGWLHRDPRRRR